MTTLNTANYTSEKLIDLVDEGVLTSEFVVNCCLYWMGTDSTGPMCNSVDFTEYGLRDGIVDNGDAFDHDGVLGLVDNGYTTFDELINLLLTWMGSFEVAEMMQRQLDMQEVAFLFDGSDDADEEDEAEEELEEFDCEELEGTINIRVLPNPATTWSARKSYMAPKKPKKPAKPRKPRRR